MKRLKALFQWLLILSVTVLFLILMLWGVDKIIPRVRKLPVYTPALSTIGMPGAVMRLVSSEFDFVVRNNSLGIRGPEIDLKHKTAFRIAVIGSSYTFGWGVAEEDCFVHVLGNALRASGLDVEMVNLGRNGGCPAQYAVLAEETLSLIQPDLVIAAIGQGCDLRWSGPLSSTERYPHLFWYYFPNLATLVHEMRYGPILMPETPPEPSTDEQILADKENIKQRALENLKSLSDEHRARFESLDPVVKEAFLSGNLNVGVIQLAMNSPDLYAGALDLSQSSLVQNQKWLKKHLASIARAARRVGAPTLIVSVPFGAYVNRPAWENTKRIGFDVVPEMLTSTIMDDSIHTAAGDLPFFSATDTFRKESDNADLFFPCDLHMAAPGHILFGNTIAPWVGEHIKTALAGN